MLIPAYDFCVPEKECCHDMENDPCDAFKQIRFPVNEFFPPSSSASQQKGDNCGCSGRAKVEKCPQDNLPEYAFIGRSNVGKSSLINMLAKRPKLAMTSSTPGKTLLINHFLINKEWYLVDLPGYGYASRGKKQVEKIQQIIEDYILEREQMTNLFVSMKLKVNTSVLMNVFVCLKICFGQIPE